MWAWLQMFISCSLYVVRSFHFHFLSFHLSPISLIFHWENHPMNIFWCRHQCCLFIAGPWASWFATRRWKMMRLHQANEISFIRSAENHKKNTIVTVDVVNMLQSNHFLYTIAQPVRNVLITRKFLLWTAVSCVGAIFYWYVYFFFGIQSILRMHAIRMKSIQWKILASMNRMHDAWIKIIQKINWNPIDLSN